jgi:glycosyltransferase involved in cell wall biosynthesis
MKLSVIIPCYNSKSTIAIQLEALAKQTWDKPWEVIISDNGSTDGTQAVVERYKSRFPNIKVVDSSDRRWAAHARNVGAKAASGESLVFVDADDEVATGWVAAIGDSLSEHNFVASRFDVLKLNETWVIEGYGRPGQETGVMQFRYPKYLSHAGGTGLGVRRSLHESIGGFNESLPVLEETDYCWRIQLKGYKLHFSPEAVVHVRWRKNIRDMFWQIFKWGEYSTLLYKWYRVRGMPRLKWKDMVSAWLPVIKALPYGYRRVGRARLAKRLGYRMGRLKGCIKHGVFAP